MPKEADLLLCPVCGAHYWPDSTLVHNMCGICGLREEDARAVILNQFLHEHPGIDPAVAEGLADIAVRGLRYRMDTENTHCFYGEPLFGTPSPWHIFEQKTIDGDLELVIRRRGWRPGLEIRGPRGLSFSDFTYRFMDTPQPYGVPQEEWDLMVRYVSGIFSH